MNENLRIVMAQIDMLVGDIPGNTAKIIAASNEARDIHRADVIVFPELTLCGYPPEDLLLRPSMQLRTEKALGEIKSAVSDITLVLGTPWYENGKRFNSAIVVNDGGPTAIYHKRKLPNYLVFDEKRYFAPGDTPLVTVIKDRKVGITICEDLWHDGPIEDCAAAGAELVLNLNASPFHLNKIHAREALLRERARSAGIPIVYVNLVGGQDELVFDGGSMVVNQQGEICCRAPQFESGLFVIDIEPGIPARPALGSISEPLALEASVYQALVLGVRDYVTKNGFKSVVLGLSGGIDSAVTLAVAVDAIGKDKVHAVMMPFRYTSEISLEDAEAEANALGVKYDVFSIEPMYEAFMQTLSAPFSGLSEDTTEENLQARCRGVLLMSLSNKFGALVLTTGNKSEMAVGYSTLYGDMAGGFDVLKDVPKTLVYRLARYRNQVSPCIPERVIDRPPSAELRPDQCDQDSLPDYDELDAILQRYVEQDFSAQAIVAEGYDEATVARVIRLVDINEYKRRQAPVGVRITDRGFGKDRRYPITSGWKAGD